MVPYSIEDLRQIISPIALQYGVESVSLFGSYSKGSAGADSDVDLKIEKGQLPIRLLSFFIRSFTFYFWL